MHSIESKPPARPSAAPTRVPPSGHDRLPDIRDPAERVELRITQRLEHLEQLAAWLADPEASPPVVDYFLPADFKLSVCVPVYNEQHTIALVIERLRRLPLPCEIVVVDDASTDGTREVLKSLARRYEIQVLFHDENRGKGAAVRTALAQTTGEVVVIQDADLEYNPLDLIEVLRPIVSGEADVCYGSRFAGDTAENSSWTHRLGNKALTWLSNRLTGLRLTDMETCYKAIHRSALEGLVIEQDRFGLEPELTAKLARRGCRFAEVPISYQARDWFEGKKIGWRDGIQAIACIVRYALRKEPSTP